jgi:hypothetical protein
MRRFIALIALIGLIQLAAGCRHVAGGCDCDHGCNTCSTPAAAVAAPPAGTPK